VSHVDVSSVSVMVDGKLLDGLVRSIEYRPHEDASPHGEFSSFSAEGSFEIEAPAFRLMWRKLNRPFKRARRRVRMARKRRRGWA
jgi:hypothetical protein